MFNSLKNLSHRPCVNCISDPFIRFRIMTEYVEFYEVYPMSEFQHILGSLQKFLLELLFTESKRR